MYLFVDTRNRNPLYAPSFCTLQSVGVAINTRVREVHRSVLNQGPCNCLSGAVQRRGETVVGPQNISLLTNCSRCVQGTEIDSE